MTREESAYKIKSANLPVLVLHLNTTDMAALQSQLQSRIDQTPDYFDDAPLALGLEGIANSGVAPLFDELIAFMRTHEIRVVGAIGGSPEQREAAAHAGLALFPATPARPAGAPEPAPPPIDEVRQPELPGFETITPEMEVQASAASDEEPFAEDPRPPFSEARPTLVIDKPVRTGQRIYAKGADLVVLSIVNAGAELIADGDIHIYAPLRGRAIAGAQGNEGARIFVQRLEAELISIAGIFRVFEEGVPEEFRGKPAQVHLEGSRLVIQPLPQGN
ncbi:MAG: septum site-determining protein MinC [Sulfuricella sp.]|nr:septum site-determining protein MinC [Sulfuricella sp.]